MQTQTEMLSFLQPLLWSISADKLDLQRDRAYIIHQVLSYGTLEHIKLLFTLYARQKVVDTFIRHPKRLYQAAVFYFIKNIVLDLMDTPLEKNKYIKNAF